MTGKLFASQLNQQQTFDRQNSFPQQMTKKTWPNKDMAGVSSWLLRKKRQHPQRILSAKLFPSTVDKKNDQIRTWLASAVGLKKHTTLHYCFIYLCHGDLSALSENLWQNKLFDPSSARKTQPKPTKNRVWWVHKNLFPRWTLSTSRPNSTQPGVRLANPSMSRLPTQDRQTLRPSTKTPGKLPCTKETDRCAGGAETIPNNQRNSTAQINNHRRGSWANGLSTSFWTCQRHFKSCMICKDIPLKRYSEYDFFVKPLFVGFFQYPPF